MGVDVVQIVAAKRPVVDVLDRRVQVVQVVERGRVGPAGPVADLDVILEAVDVAVGDYFVLHPQTFVYDQPPGESYFLDILHPLDHLPAVTVTDSAGTQWIGEVSWPAPNRVRVDYNHVHSGLRATLT